MQHSANVARLELRGISKSYPGIVANDDISLAVAPGRIHAVLGENGAGKTTLMKIIYGATRSDSGSILWNGRPVTVGSPAAARRLGIGMVFQHFSLFPALTVLENLMLSLPSGRSPAAVALAASELAGRYGLKIGLTRPVHSLAVGERQQVEIVRCLLQDPRLLILDEPTSVLTPKAVAELFQLLRALASSGCSILYISHKLHEVQELCDEATILRRGRVIATLDPSRETVAALAERMIGEVTPPIRRSARGQAPSTRLTVGNLDRPAGAIHSVALRGIQLAARGGEILGLAGIAGNGQNELLEALSGEWIGAAPEAIRIDGIPAGRLGPVERRRLGLVYLPEERLGHGAVPAMSLTKNALLTTAHLGLVRAGLIDIDAVKSFATACITKYDVRSGTLDGDAGTLSGGNLQKFIVGRELSQTPGIVVAHQPTWGLDHGAANAVRRSLLAMRDSGVAILVVSEDIDELFEICDRIAVISAGQLSPSRAVEDTTVEEIGQFMAGRGFPPDAMAQDATRHVAQT